MPISSDQDGTQDLMISSSPADSEITRLPKMIDMLQDLNSVTKIDASETSSQKKCRSYHEPPEIN